MTFLEERDRQPELMDQPGLDHYTHHHALAGLRTTNAISRTSQVIWRGIQDAGIVAQNAGPLRILDIASGGGDVLIGIAKLAARHGIAIQAHGCDISPTAIKFAQEAANRAKVSDTKFFQLNALVDSLPEEYDAVMATLFLHHLTNVDAQQLLSRMAKAAKRCVVIDDLCRNRLGYLYAWVGARLFTRSLIVHTDGPLSVRAAYTIPEFRQLAEGAGLRGPIFKRHWPQRFLMTWKKS